MKQSWPVKRLKFLANLNPSKGFSNLLSNESEAVVFLPMERVSEDGGFDQTLRKPISELRSGFTYFEKNDIIVAKITPCFENGKAAILENLATPLAFGSTEFHVLRAKSILDRKFLWNVIRGHRFRTEGEAFMAGAAGQKRVPESYIADYLVAVPPLPEQLAIATFLDDKTNQIDTLIEKKRKMIELLKEERQAVINHAVTKGLDLHAKMKPSGIEWLGDVPEAWPLLKVKYVACLANDKGELDPQLLRVENENIESWTGRFLETDTTFDERDELKMFRAGDVLFNKLRPYLAKVFNPRTAGFSGGELLILRPTSKLNSAFLFYRLLSRSFIGIVNSSTEGAKMPRADWEFIGQLLIPIPTLSEQFAISSFLDVKTKQIDTLIAKAVTGIALLTEYRTALITDVVTGKVDVSEYAK